MQLGNLNDVIQALHVTMLVVAMYLVGVPERAFIHRHEVEANP